MLLISIGVTILMVIMAVWYRRKLKRRGIRSFMETVLMMLGALMILMGTAFLICSISLSYGHKKELGRSTEVTAIVSDIKKRNLKMASVDGGDGYINAVKSDVFIDYEYSGIEYHGVELKDFSSSVSDFRLDGVNKGDEMEVLVDIENPSLAFHKPIWFGETISRLLMWGIATSTAGMIALTVGGMFIGKIEDKYRKSSA